MTHAELSAAATAPHRVGDAVRQISSGRRATVERVFTSAMPGEETACAFACRIDDGETRPVFIFAASELEAA